MGRVLTATITIAMILFLCPSAASSQQHILTQLTFSDSTHDGYPCWSPDGHYIIYSSSTSSNSQTWKIPANGGTPELIADNFAQHARWSPLGDYIAFDGDLGTQIQVVSSAGGTPIRLDPDTIPISRGGMPCWSPDGKKIAFKSLYTIYMMDLETGELSTLYQQEGKCAIPYDWTPDGSTILVEVSDTANRSQSDIWEVPLNGRPRQVTFLSGKQEKPAISPDGSLILFSSDHGGDRDLWLTPATGGDPAQLTIFEGDGENPGRHIEGSWSPDGKSIAFSSARGDLGKIWRMDLDLKSFSGKLGNTVKYTVLYPTIDTGSIPIFPFLLDENPMQPSPSVSWSGREFVLAQTKDDRYAWFDATVENGVAFSDKNSIWEKGSQLIADTADFSAFASSGIHSMEELKSTRSITGRSVSRITVDGRPGRSSGVGFMASDETILSVISGDNQMVKKLGLKHPDLARPLLQLWNIYNSGEMYNDHSPVEKRVGIRGVVYWGKEIELKVSDSSGWQESIFNDEIRGSYQLEVRRELNPAEEEFLNAQYSHLTVEKRDELRSKISSLHTGEMVPYYINRYGFYEGHTGFRAEPLSIAFIFGIRSLEEIHQACGEDLYGYLTQHFTHIP
jgi:Tol biopolymer transport system component